MKIEALLFDSAVHYLGYFLQGFWLRRRLADGERLQSRRNPPKLGLDSAAIQAEAGFDEIQIAGYIEKGVVRAADTESESR